ncbi:hypothetical protein PIIN_01731 [Serendipita indica DSM 11827]|uniref:Uncharacterized protein n=1 Tax=Serendipita indica (strain DSM 11827) TaxID=1109443 RepID=G4U3B7_SERID|nr:hypothetical protein PIIN_01731 [Serendipita indica DSM 11827]
MSYSPDTSSRAYKKALRLHNKSKKTPAAEVLPALREQEKQYKSRFPPPSLDDALDIRAVWQDPDDAAQVWKGSPDAVRIESIGCLSEERPHAKAYGIPELPGFLLLPGFLRPNEQRRLIKAILEDYAKAPNENNLDIHYILPEDGIWPSWKAYNDRKAKGYSEEPIIATKASASDMNVPGSSRVLIENPPASVENLAEFQALEKPPAAPSATLSPSPLSSLVHKLRWSNIGYFYHWGTKSYQFDRELTPIPSYIQQICKECVSSVNWSDVWRDGADMKAGRWDTEHPDWSEWPKTYGYVNGACGQIGALVDLTSCLNFVGLGMCIPHWGSYEGGESHSHCFALWRCGNHVWTSLSAGVSCRVPGDDQAQYQCEAGLSNQLCV